MIIIPEKEPVVQNLNSYYLDIKRLIEHYQGELGSGGIYFKSSFAEGAIFFDEDTVLKGTFRNKEGVVAGDEAIDRLIDILSNNNFSVAVYKLDPERVYFWSNLQNVEEYYKNLSTEFTDLEGLINKMSAEKLTGYIDVSIQGEKEDGLIFFDNGAIIDCSCSWENEALSSSTENQELLILKSKESGGVFNVSRIVFKKPEVRGVPSKEVRTFQDHVLDMIQELLLIFERSVGGNKKIKADFGTLLKRKFVDNVDKYDFLDPFAAEFQYAGGKVKFTGEADDQQLAKGLVESVYELAEELGILSQLRKDLAPWMKKYHQEIEKFNIGI
jgi:hypothetical protein